MAYDNSSKIQVKQEPLIGSGNLAVKSPGNSTPAQIIYLSSSDDDFDDDSSSDDESRNISNNNKRPRDSSDGNARRRKTKRAKDLNSVLPAGFLDPLPSAATALALPPPYEELPPSPLPLPSSPLPLAADRVDGVVDASGGNRQFWKAGDYEGVPCGDWESSSGGMDHVRVHPKFLHSNATSHKWVLGALAELLDNSLDEVCNGATFVNIDMVKSKKDGSKMLLIEDNGGGMDPDKMRHCMSLGYSAKSNMVNTIGQYGNGFKTSTMRLGADVIVFSRCAGDNGRRPTQSIGLLSYTFLKTTGKEDIIVPMLDYQKRGQDWDKIIRSSATDWMLNVETIVQWSPFTSEADLLQQFNQMKDQGTRIIIYNLWEDDQGLLELDFDTDPHDIQIRGVNRDEKSIDMANKYPNSRHFLTYRHSLRSYAAILYLRIPPGFRIILRGKDVEHHNVVNDMMMSQEITYRPQPGEGIPKDINMVAVVTVGFVKDAKAHIDVQGFNVYHKNRLIKPFWRVWHPPGSDGRGVIGVLEANFVEPAHDKQGFERTIVLAKLETRLIQMQKNYWNSLCHKIGYAPRRSKKSHQREISPEPSSQSKGRSFASNGKMLPNLVEKRHDNGHLHGKGDVRTPRKRPSYAEQSPASAEHVSDDDRQMHTPGKQAYGLRSKEKPSVFRGHDAVVNNMPAGRLTPATRISTNSQDDGLNSIAFSSSSSSSAVLAQLREENLQLKERLRRKEEEIVGDLLLDLQQEREKNKLLEAQLQEAERKNEELTKEQDSLIDIFSEERQRRDSEEENLRKKLRDASNTIQELLDKMKILERMKGLK